MQHFRRLLLITCFLLFAAAFASADQITTNFTLNPVPRTNEPGHRLRFS